MTYRSRARDKKGRRDGGKWGRRWRNKYVEKDKEVELPEGSCVGHVCILHKVVMVAVWARVEGSKVVEIEMCS